MDADTYNDELRSARAAMTEMDRARDCSHSRRGRNGVCPDCGDDIRGDV